MRDIVEELSNLFKYAPLPIPSAVEMADRNLAKEMGIDLDAMEPECSTRS